MTSSNLARVFGPNLAWCRDITRSFNNTEDVNEAVKFLLDHHEEVFAREAVQTSLR